jgi:hypothetical protein
METSHWFLNEIVEYLFYTAGLVVGYEVQVQMLWVCMLVHGQLSSALGGFSDAPLGGASRAWGVMTTLVGR